MRRFEPGDAEPVAEWARRSGLSAWTPDSLRTAAAAPAARTVVLEREGRPVAAALGTVAADEASLDLLIVAPTARRRGWGRRALAAWLERARGAGATVAHLEVARGNGAAAGLYRAAGFCCVGSRSAYYADGDDALIFSKSPLPGADDPEAFILAGGRARRLGGRAKPLVRRRDGRTLLEALVTSLQPFTRRIWLCAPPSVAAGLRVAEPIAAGLPLASDDGRGPGRAVQRALERSESDRVLWTVADWARPHPDLWSALLDGLDSADAAVVEAGGRRQVGAVVARRSALPPAPTSSLQGLLRGVDVRAIAERSLSAAARAALFDIDEPGDLRVADPILAPGDERPEDPGNAA